MTASLWLRKNERLLTLIVSGALILLGWLIAPARRYLMIAAAIVAGYRIAQTAWIALRAKVVSIQLLVSIAAIGGIFIGEQWEAAAVTFLFALGNYLEARTLNKTRRYSATLKWPPPQPSSCAWRGSEVIRRG